MQEPKPSPETERIYNLLRLWGATALIATAIVLVLFDCIDDIYLGGHYAGVPLWLSGIVAGIVAFLFGRHLFR